MDDLFDKYIKGTDKKLDALDKMIYKVFLDYFVDNLSLDGNRVKYTNSNIGAVNKLDSVYDRFSTAIRKIGEWIIKGILEILGKTITNLSLINTKAIANGVKVVADIQKHAATTLNQNLNLSVIFADVKREALILMAKPDGITLKELRKALHNKVLDNKIASRYFARWIHDIYSQYQRVGANEIRKTLGLKYAIYQGGLIETSRPFCNERNNKVFHEDEITKWADLEWAGKPEIGYNPIADLGGYNCRHRLDWISDEMAESLKK